MRPPAHEYGHEHAHGTSTGAGAGSGSGYAGVRSARPPVLGPGEPAGSAAYVKETSAKFSWVSGETFGGLTFLPKAMAGGEEEIGTPGR